MKFKILIFFTLIVVVLVSYFVFAVKKTSKLQSPISQKKESPGKSAVKMDNKTSVYNDPAGFKFSYPDSLKVEVLDKTDPIYYSALQLKSLETAGSITIEATSTRYKTLEEWVKNNKEIAGNSKSIKLADLEAKEIKSEGKINIFAVDLDILLTFTASFTKADEKYWQEATDKIITTFAFEQPESTAENSGSEPVNEDVVFEGEEVIE